MDTRSARFSVGQVIYHKLFQYRGVIVDVDPVFQGSEAWYQQVARTRPPKDSPWYHVLVSDEGHRTYVAERNLAPDESGNTIRHPELDDYFESFQDGRYTPRQKSN